MSTPALTPPVAPEDRPFYQSPWLWSFILGAFVITALRPCTRYIPDAPEVEGELPEFVLFDQDANDIGTEWLDGRVVILTVGYPGCGDGCGVSYARAGEICEQLGEVELEFEIMTLDASDDGLSSEELAAWAADVGSECERWRFVSGDRTQRFAMLESLSVPTGSGEGADLSAAVWLAIIDENGGIRGRYDARRSESSDEVYHRSQHVFREQRTGR